MWPRGPTPVSKNDRRYRHRPCTPAAFSSSPLYYHAKFGFRWDKPIPSPSFLQAGSVVLFSFVSIPVSIAVRYRDLSLAETRQGSQRVCGFASVALSVPALAILFSSFSSFLGDSDETLGVDFSCLES